MSFQLNNITILFVDDEKDLLEVIAEELELEGANVIKANNGLDALEKFHKNPNVDFIISDLNMPNMSGLELLKKIRETNPKFPTFFCLSGFADSNSIEAYNFGANSVLSKPIRFDLLLSTLKNFIVPRDSKWLRKFERINVNASAYFKFQTVEASLKTKIINIGLGGMFIHTLLPHPPLGTKIDIFIEYDQNEQQGLNIQGVVRWSRKESLEGLPIGLGIEFLYLNENAQITLFQLINNARQLSYIPSQ